MSTLTDPPVEVPEGLLRAVRVAYDSPPRPYHSFAHVLEVQRHFHEVAAGPGWEQPREVFLAVLFHDVIVVPGRTDNEVKSAEWALNALETWPLPGGLDVSRIEALIRLTAKHGRLTPRDVDADAAHFLDADMAILGAAPDVFDAYDAAIAREYTGHVPGILYRLARGRFLQRLADADRLFLSDFFHQRYDAPARDNLRRALAA